MNETDFRYEESDPFTMLANLRKDIRTLKDKVKKYEIDNKLVYSIANRINLLKKRGMKIDIEERDYNELVGELKQRPI